MFTMDEPIDAHCPQCANDAVHVESIAIHPASESESYLCRCAQCGWRFRVRVPDSIAAGGPPGRHLTRNDR